MAHAADLRDLIVKLVDSVRTHESDGTRAVEEAFKRLRETTHARINPFEVESQLAGLVEKFEILNRDDLSNDLQRCLDQLDLKSGFIPDVLTLILELSDRPVEKSRPRLDNEEHEDQSQPWSWSDINARDILEEEAIWDDVDRGYHSSGDDQTEHDDADSEHASSTQATSIADDDLASIARSYLVQPDFAGLNRLGEAANEERQSLQCDKPARIAELSHIRETLDTLLGLPTVLQKNPGSIPEASSRYRLSSTSSRTIDAMSVEVSEIAFHIHRLREWAVNDSKIPYIQAMQSAIQAELCHFDCDIQAIAQTFLRPARNVIVSILGAKAKIDTAARRVLPIVRPVDQWLNESGEKPYMLLQTMYEATCSAQLSADDVALDVLETVFLTGLNAYLAPVSHWMTTGRVSEEYDFFVKIQHDKRAQGTLWRDRYTLRVADNNPCAPRVLHPFLDNMLAIGKSRAFLDITGRRSGPVEDMSASANILTKRNIQQRLAAEPLLPFHEALHHAVRDWILQTGSGSREELSVAIAADPELWRAIEALRCLYFAPDGLQFPDFARSLFGCDSATAGHSFMLTRLARASLGSVDTVDASRMSVNVLAAEAASSQIRALACVVLQYDLPWLLQNVAQTETLQLHPQVFTILLQCQCVRERMHIYTSALRSSIGEGPPSAQGSLLKLRHLLLWFANTWFSHVASTSSHLHAKLLAQLKSALDIDGMTQAWAAYQRALELTLLLSSRCRPVLNGVLDILELSERFQDVWERCFPAAGNQQTRASRHLDLRPTQLLDSFEQSLSFVQAGVRSISRAAGEPALESLSSALDGRHGAFT